MPTFRCELRADPGGADTFVVHGDVDLSNAGDLVEQALPQIERAPDRPLLLDLAAVTFLDSTGIGALLEIRKAANAAGRGTRICAMSPAVRRVLDLAGLSEVFTPGSAS